MEKIHFHVLGIDKFNNPTCMSNFPSFPCTLAYLHGRPSKCPRRCSWNRRSQPAVGGHSWKTPQRWYRRWCCHVSKPLAPGQHAGRTAGRWHRLSQWRRHCHWGRTATKVGRRDWVWKCYFLVTSCLFISTQLNNIDSYFTSVSLNERLDFENTFLKGVYLNVKPIPYMKIQQF